MSHERNMKIDNVDYLMEKNDEHVHIAKKNSEDGNTLIFEGSYTAFFWGEEISDDLKVIKTLSEDDALYTILLYCLDFKMIINREAHYQEYLFSLLKDGHTKEEILSSSSDEVTIYENYYPLDIERENFKKVTSSMVDGYFYMQSKNIQ